MFGTSLQYPLVFGAPSRCFFAIFHHTKPRSNIDIFVCGGSGEKWGDVGGSGGKWVEVGVGVGVGGGMGVGCGLWV